MIIFKVYPKQRGHIFQENLNNPSAINFFRQKFFIFPFTPVNFDTKEAITILLFIDRKTNDKSKDQMTTALNKSFKCEYIRFLFITLEGRSKLR